MAKQKTDKTIASVNGAAAVEPTTNPGSLPITKEAPHSSTLYRK